MKRCNEGIFGDDGNDVWSVVVLVTVNYISLLRTIAVNMIKLKPYLDFFFSS